MLGNHNLSYLLCHVSCHVPTWRSFSMSTACPVSRRRPCLPRIAPLPPASWGDSCLPGQSPFFLYLFFPLSLYDFFSFFICPFLFPYLSIYLFFICHFLFLYLSFPHSYLSFSLYFLFSFFICPFPLSLSVLSYFIPIFFFIFTFLFL